MAPTSDTSTLHHGAMKQRLFRVLLEPRAPQRSWYRIAKDAGTSYGWAHPVLRDLQDQGLLHQHRILDPPGLFQQWAHMPQRANTSDFQIQKPDRLFQAPHLRYAWTTYYAESLIQHQLVPRRLDFYTTPQDWNPWRKRLADEGLIGQGNLRILLADPHILDTARTLRGHAIVSTPQLIVDLMREGGPCRQAADLLLEKEYGASGAEGNLQTRQGLPINVTMGQTTADALRDRLHQHREEILRIAAQHGAHNVRLFGSVLKGDAQPDSDADFLVTFSPEASPYARLDLKQDLEALLGVDVDIVSDAALHRVIRDEILKGAVPV